MAFYREPLAHHRGLVYLTTWVHGCTSLTLLQIIYSSDETILKQNLQRLGDMDHRQYLYRERICQLCGLEPQAEEPYICKSPIYYEISGRHHRLFKEGFWPFSKVMNYNHQKFLGLFLLEIKRCKEHFLPNRHMSPVELIGNMVFSIKHYKNDRQNSLN